MKYILTIDRGQTAIKAALCDLMARVLWVESCSCHPIESRYAGWAEQDMNAIWEQAVLAIRKVIQVSGVRSEEIAAVSFSGQGGGNFLVSEEGEPVYPGVLSLDNRHEEVLQELIGSGHTDLPRTVAFMRWLKEKEPEVFGRTRWILGSKDWIRYCLTGEAYADMSDPAIPADLDRGVYLTDCLEEAGVPECRRMIPPLVYASDRCGAVTEKASRETGLLCGTPVVAGAHDMIACSVGAGGNHPGHLTIIMGTMGINIGVVDGKKPLPPPSAPGTSFTFGGISRGMKTATSSIGSGCNTMDYFIRLLFREEEQEARVRGIGVFELLERKLLGRKPGNLIFQPYLLGTFYNSRASAGIWGMTAQTTREDILLALFEGICLSMCMEIRTLEARLQRFDDIWLVGGGSKSRIWGQMFADVLGRPVKIPDTGEVGCRGAAVCAGIALGQYSADSGLPAPEESAVYEPRAEYAQIYEDKFRQYEETYKKLYQEVKGYACDNERDSGQSE